MKLKIDNNLNNTNINDEDDALSLRDLQLYDQTATSSTRSSPRASSGLLEPFEFLPTPPNHPTAPENIVFCGKVISNSVEKEETEDESHETLNINIINSHSYRSASYRLHDRRAEHVVPVRSVSDRDLGSPRHHLKFSSYNKRVHSLASKSKRRMFMLGPVKFMPEMEMKSLKERQARRNPSLRMFPVAEGGGGAKEAVAATDKSERVRCRARLNSLLERSLACLRI